MESEPSHGGRVKRASVIPLKIQGYCGPLLDLAMMERFRLG